MSVSGNYGWSSAPYGTGGYYSRPAYQPAQTASWAAGYSMPSSTVPSMTPSVTWVPVMRPVTPAARPEEKPVTATTEALKPEGMQNLAGVSGGADASLPVNETAKEAAPKTEKPLTRAEAMGKKVGDFATGIFEQNPQLLDRLEKLNWETMTQDPGSIANRFRDAFQQSRLFRLLPKRLDRHIAGMFPRDMEPAVQDVLTWLRTKPTADPLADLTGGLDPTVV